MRHLEEVRPTDQRVYAMPDIISDLHQPVARVEKVLCVVFELYAEEAAPRTDLPGPECAYARMLPSRRRRLHAWPGMLLAPSSIFLPGAAHGGAPGAGARLRTNSFRGSMRVGPFQTHVAKAVLCDWLAFGGCREASCAACVIVSKFCDRLDSLVRRMDFPCAEICDSRVFHFIILVSLFLEPWQGGRAGCGLCCWPGVVRNCMTRSFGQSPS